MPKPENLIPFKWKKGQSGNPKGRPRKTVSATLKALKDAGIPEVTKNEIIATYMNLMNCTGDELRELYKDKTQTILIQTIAKRICDKKLDVIETMLDRTIGKPKQDIGIQVDSEVLPLNFFVDGKEKT